MSQYVRKRSVSNGARTWMHVMVPYQIAYNPISTIIALYILALHGSVIDVAYAATLANFIIIPASIFWGEMVGKYNKRRFFINLSFIGLALSLVGLYYSTNVIEVTLLYGFMSFMIMANSTPLNLLIMETEPRERWSSAFSGLQMLSSMGSVVSLIFASILAYAVSIRVLMLALVPFTVLAMLFAFPIPEPSVSIDRKTLTKIHPGQAHAYPGSGLYGLGLKDISRMYGSVKEIFRRSNFQKLMLAIFAFYLATGLFNTAYPAGLKQSGISDFWIFLIFAISTTMSMITFFALEYVTPKLRDKNALSTSLIIRGSGYILIGLVFAVLGGVVFIGLNVIAYVFTSGLAYALFYTTMNAMVFRAVAGGTDKSYKLGIYSGAIGLGTLLGSLFAGYLSYFIGYWFTFAVAGSMIIACLFLFLDYLKPGDSASGLPVPS